MLNQSKTAYQAEIDAACETIDFLRFNAEYLVRIYEEQPVSSAGVWNRMEYRALEGFVLAISPFNFTAIGANLTTSPALMGNTVVWKPASTQALSAWITMRVLEEAGLPPGVINLVFGPGAEMGAAALASPELAGVHFTGSTGVFHSIWRTIGNDIDRYRNYPRIVGETGGKDFILAHPVGDPGAGRGRDRARLVRVPGPEVLGLVAALHSLEPLGGGPRDARRARSARSAMGDVSDFTNFMGAVIDEPSFRRSATRSPRRRRRAPRSSPAAAPTTARAGSSSRR